MPRLLQAVKGAFIALFVPAHFSVTSGHLRSALSGKSVDYAGRPVPWYTFSATSFLSNVDFTGYSVLEFGGGYSTLWWAERADSVLTLEHDRAWYERLRRELESAANVELVLREDLDEYVSYPRGRTFDVVVVDGEERRLCSESALEVVADDGVILLDDAEGSWGRPGTYPIVELLQGAGFSRVDFYGYCPGVRRPHSTSIFFRDGARLFRTLRPPARPYVV